MQKNYRSNKTVTVSATALQKALNESRFSGLSWVTIIEAYFKSPLIGNRERQQSKQDARALCFRHILDSYNQQRSPIASQMPDQGQWGATAWLEEVLLQKDANGYRHLMQQHKTSPEQLRTMLPMVLLAADSLPTYENRWERLPIFAAHITGDPHYFDEGTWCFKMLTMFIIWRFKIKREDSLAEPEWRNQVLFQAGILKDALSNVTIAYGLHGSRQGVLHQGIEGFFQMREPLYLTLQTLGALDQIHSEGQSVVYVLENPAVFSALVEQFPTICAVCANGQPRLATLVLLDKLSEHSLLYYAGNFDPEGLVIAQNLKKRYQDRLIFWAYDQAHYHRNRSSVILSDERLHKLNAIEEPALLPIKEAILFHGYAVYQEKMLTVYAEDLEQTKN